MNIEKAKIIKKREQDGICKYCKYNHNTCTILNICKLEEEQKQYDETGNETENSRNV